jgi:hypothetical protein
MTLAGHVSVLRGLIDLDPDSRLIDVALVNAIEEMAQALDGLRGRFGDGDGDDDPPRGLGTI